MNKFLAAFLATLVALFVVFVVAVLATWPVAFVNDHQKWFAFLPGVVGVLMYKVFRGK